MHAIMRPGLAAPLLAAALCGSLSAGVVLQPQDAPDWQVSEWINGDPGNLRAQKGKIVLIHFFQLWCPGCNDFSIPLFQEWEEKFGSRDDVTILSIHTVFEGHDVQTPERLRAFVQEKGIRHPVGMDAYAPGESEVPVTMDRYETGGTPHVVIIDKKGDLRFTHFGHFDPGPVEAYIDRLLTEKKNFNARIKSDGNDRRSSGSSRTQRPPTRGREQPPAQPEPGAAAKTGTRSPDGKDATVSGSYKLQFEQFSNSCTETGPPMEVITQIAVYEDRIEAKLSRAYLGVRQITVDYDSGTGDVYADLQQTVKERNVEMGLSLQLSGTILIGIDPPEIEFRYNLVKQRPGDGDCVIEGQGSGARFRSRR